MITQDQSKTTAAEAVAEVQVFSHAEMHWSGVGAEAQR
jgi:hypothetical protein